PNAPGCCLSAGSPSLSPMARLYRAPTGSELRGWTSSTVSERTCADVAAARGQVARSSLKVKQLGKEDDRVADDDPHQGSLRHRRAFGGRERAHLEVAERRELRIDDEVTLRRQLLQTFVARADAEVGHLDGVARLRDWQRVGDHGDRERGASLLSEVGRE